MKQQRTTAIDGASQARWTTEVPILQRRRPSHPRVAKPYLVSTRRMMDFVALNRSFKIMLASSRALAAEIGPALFEEGGRSFLCLGAVVVERQRLEAERADAADVRAVGV